ncbi:MAG: hypothetical protein JNG89_13445, partial [Planctomycetaceae bacterium]|nr:hypothetical protein [Planctomycetaceae bacterium]
MQHPLFRAAALTCIIAVAQGRLWAQDAFPHTYAWTVLECRSEFELPDSETVGQELQSVHGELQQATGLEFSTDPVQLTLFA